MKGENNKYVVNTLNAGLQSLWRKEQIWPLSPPPKSVDFHLFIFFKTAGLLFAVLVLLFHDKFKYINGNVNFDKCKKQRLDIIMRDSSTVNMSVDGVKLSSKCYNLTNSYQACV